MAAHTLSRPLPWHGDEPAGITTGHTYSANGWRTADVACDAVSTSIATDTTRDPYRRVLTTRSPGDSTVPASVSTARGGPAPGRVSSTAAAWPQGIDSQRPKTLH